MSNNKDSNNLAEGIQIHLPISNCAIKLVATPQDVLNCLVSVFEKNKSNLSNWHTLDDEAMKLFVYAISSEMIDRLVSMKKLQIKRELFEKLKGEILAEAITVEERSSTNLKGLVLTLKDNKSLMARNCFRVLLKDRIEKFYLWSKILQISGVLESVLGEDDILSNIIPDILTA